MSAGGGQPAGGADPIRLFESMCSVSPALSAGLTFQNRYNKIISIVKLKQKNQASFQKRIRRTALVLCGTRALFNSGERKKAARRSHEKGGGYSRLTGIKRGRKWNRWPWKDACTGSARLSCLPAGSGTDRHGNGGSGCPAGNGTDCPAENDECRSSGAEPCRIPAGESGLMKKEKREM